MHLRPEDDISACCTTRHEEVLADAKKTKDTKGGPVKLPPDVLSSRCAAVHHGHKNALHADGSVYWNNPKMLRMPGKWCNF